MKSRRIAVIIGSVRPRRIGPKIAEWVAEIGRRAGMKDIETIDLRDWPLPMDEEPNVPATGNYIQPQTIAWSEKIAGMDAFVFVTPQYNWGYPAALKNALDHLYREWSGKPAMIVSYGGHGGDKCDAQLRQVFEGLKMQTIDISLALILTRAEIEANSGEIDPAVQFTAEESKLRDAFSQLYAVVDDPSAG